MKRQKIKNSQIAFRFKRFAKKTYSAFNSMHKVVNIGVLSGCALAISFTTTTSAQVSSRDSVAHSKPGDKELEEVTVTASRVNLSLNQSARLVTIISKSEIDRAPVQSIQDLLNYAANIDVIQRGGRGVQADISIRGGSFDQTAILLNGINLSNPQTGHYSLDIPINLSDIDHIEIIHGPASITYGASAFSGGINIITKKNIDHKVFSKIEVGSHNSYNIEAQGNIKNSFSSNTLSVGYNTSDGYIENSDFDLINILWQTHLKPEKKSNIDIQLGYNDKKYGANTFYSAAYPNQYDKTQTYFASISGESGDKLKFIPKIYWSKHNDCFQLFRGGTSNIPDWYTSHNYHKTDVYGVNFNLQYTSKIGITSFGSEFRNEGIVSNVLGKICENYEGRYPKSDNRSNISFALEHNILLRKFTFSIGILTNKNTSLDEDFKLYPAINASYRMIDNLKIYTSWNKAMRMPTFTDLYYTTATHIGNTNLKYEESESYEIGFKYNNHFIDAYVSTYLMKGDNIIDWVKPNIDDKWESRNITNIDKKGIEIGSKIYLNEFIKELNNNNFINIGYTRLHQKKSSKEFISNYALNYLRDKLVVQLNHSIHKNISASWNFRWQNRMGSYIKYEDFKPGRETSYSPFSTLDLKLNWKLKDLNISLSANNIYDTKYYDLGNIPQAGFWLSGGVSYVIR